MINIKLPGSQKNKKIVLLILLAIIILILVFEGISNKNSRINIDSNDKIMEEVDNEEFIKEENEILINENYIRENKLYDETYNLFFSKEYTKAIEKSNELIKEFPNSKKGYNIRGISKAYNNDFQGGIADIDKALEIDSKYGYAIFNKALTYELYEKLDEALIWYNKNLEVENYLWTYYGISSIYGRKGDVGNTIKYLSKAIEMDSIVKEEAKNERDFDAVRGDKEFQDLINN